jgi:D-3-phosphoglycerate dehydrogenase
LNLIRDVSRVNNLLHEGKWEKTTGHLLKNMKVLIVGYGRIGKTVASILDTIGAKILVYDPFVSGKIIPKNYTRVDLADGIKIAEVITLHNSGEVLMLGETEFGMMKPGVYILNAARGGLIDEDALEQALVSGIVAGAWLDTFKEEPYTGSLSKYNQVILTPHIGSYTFEGRQKMEFDCVKNLLSGFESEKISLE